MVGVTPLKVLPQVWVGLRIRNLNTYVLHGSISCCSTSDKDPELLFQLPSEPKTWASAPNRVRFMLSSVNVGVIPAIVSVVATCRRRFGLRVTSMVLVWQG